MWFADYRSPSAFSLAFDNGQLIRSNPERCHRSMVDWNLCEPHTVGSLGIAIAKNNLTLIGLIMRIL